VHRDVKPGNLLVTPEGRTKLTDLGLASFSSESPAAEGPRHIVGTPDFIAPEAISTPSEVRPSSDIYSLGCTLYYAVTGKVPFPGGATRDKLRRHLDEAPLSPILFTPQLDPALAELIAQMMHKRPADRIGSAVEVVDRLRPWSVAADETTWRQIGQFATAPGERSFAGATLEDTIVADASELDTSEQTPARRTDATASILLKSDVELDKAGDEERVRALPPLVSGLIRLPTRLLHAALLLPRRLLRRSAES
jgi:serine/threonine protein kinase